MTEEIRLGDVISTRKPHPCGGSEWTVVRTGADIGANHGLLACRLQHARNLFEVLFRILAAADHEAHEEAPAKGHGDDGDGQRKGGRA